MARKIFSGILITLSSMLLLLSVVGIGAAWYYNESLTGEAVARLGEIEAELARTQTALQAAKAELERTLRIVDSAEQTLANLSDELAQAKALFDEFDKTLGDRLIPGLENSRERLNSLRGTLEDLRTGLEDLNSLPFLSLNLPGDEMLANLIETVNSIEAQIERMRGLADKASTFSEDVSFLMGGDFSETRQRLETFVQVVTEYEQKIAGWHAQVETWIAALPGWIDRASVILTVFLFWFGLSQFGLLLHGLVLWRGNNPLVVLRSEPPAALPPPDEDQFVLVDEVGLDENDENPEKMK
jgi:chromosome segregation ATPase